MNKSQRIYFQSGDTTAEHNVIVQLEQDVDTIEFLSMSISTKDAYKDFNSDYGVLVGRVVANGGVGIPNAKISIFIPLSETDANDSEISSLYPYTTPRDKNIDGKRYNLLPRVGKVNSDGTVSPKQPFGSFPIKEETIINESFLNVYKKYYKYTALTNNAGDYMIFGVPIGTQTVHLSVDITDIGKFSMNPAAMVTNLGYSPNLFYDNNSKIKPSNDLNDLPNIETQEISVDIVPFWGDSENFQIGITRQDFRIRSVLTNTFVIFGTAFTDGNDSMWGSDHSGSKYIAEMFRIRNEESVNISMVSKRIGKITEKIYYYPPEITDAELNGNPLLPNYPDPNTDMLVLDSSQYSAYKKDGDFVYIINCNRRKVITDEFGNEVVVSDDSPNGIFTQFRGFITLEIANEDVPMNFTGKIGDNTTVEPFRVRYKFPQTSGNGNSFDRPLSDETESPATDVWRKEHRIFTGGTIYSVAHFHGTTYNSYTGADNNQFDSGSYPNFMDKTTVNKPYNADPYWNVGIIQTGTGGDVNESEQYEFPSNSITDVGTKVFGANWMNFCVYFPQLGFLRNGYSYIKDVRFNDNFHQSMYQQAGWNGYYCNDNGQKIAARQINTKWFARSDLHWTDFVEVPKEDILKINNWGKKGFTSNNVPGLIGKYRNGTRVPTGVTYWATTACPYNGGKNNGNPSASPDTKYYFYKGMKDANCIEFLISLGLV